MEISASMSELVALAVAVAVSGAVAGILAGLFGIGGGVVLVPILYQGLAYLGVDESIRMHLSVGTSVAIIVPTSIRSFLAHKRRGAADLDLLRSWLLPVPLGTILATITVAYISGAQLRGIFAAVALVVGLRLIFDREHWRLGTDIPAGPVRAAIGVVIGFFSTLMGIGGGVLNNTFMTLYGRTMHQAVATSAGVGVLVSIPGIIGYFWAGWGNALLPPLSIGFVNLVGVALVIPISFYLAPVGVRLAHALSRRQLELAFGFFLLFVAARFAISVL